MKTKNVQNEQKELKVQINKDPICCRAEPDSKSVKHPVRAYMVSVFYLIIFSRLAQIQYSDYKLINQLWGLKKMTVPPGWILQKLKTVLPKRIFLLHNH